MDHLNRVIDALSAYRESNRRPAIDEPKDQFEQMVNKHFDLDALQDIIKEAVAPLNAEERKLRDTIAGSLREFYGYRLNEGMNTYELSNFRKLKFTHKVERKVLTDQVIFRWNEGLIFLAKMK